MKRTSFAALAVLAACAPAAEAPLAGPTPLAAVSAAVNPLGTFEFATDAEGQTVAGSIQVTGEPGFYGGHVRIPAGDFLISGVTAAGQQMVVTADTPAGALTITMNFTGAAFTGAWTLDGDRGEIRGQRTP